jgi:L-lysine 2,3-aminomutase
MTQTKQMTLPTDLGENIVIKVRRMTGGNGGIRYSVDVNGWKSRVLVKLDELTADSTDGMIDQALDLAMDKGFARWLKSED